MSNAYIVRFGTTRLVGEFSANAERQYARGDEVVVRSTRGVEWGEVLCPATEKTREYLGANDSAGRILRPINEQDVARRDEITAQEPQHFTGIRDTIAEHKLQMQVVDIEHLFGGERLIIYYLAEQRVDFRQLVKALAKQFKTRIEMRQIGVRDEAKLMADYGDCGKPVCCNTHLREMPPVAMKMAKVQKATLDPSKISGRCGRLKCCLRYEYDTYEEYRRELPRVGATVVTKDGQGRVIGQEILAKKVLVVYEDQRRMLVDGSSILTVIKSSGGGKKNPSLN
jgi:cell fate regulator YaaT (PSP1 superfamily)